MTEQPLLPQPDEAPEDAVATPKRRQRDLVPWFYGLGFVVLAAAIFYLWQYPAVPVAPVGDAAAVQTVEQHLEEIEARLSRLEQRPVADLDQVTRRLDAIDARTGDQTQLAKGIDALSGRIESLSGRSQRGLDATKQQLDALTNQVASIESNAGNLSAVTSRLNRIAKLQQASFALATGQPIGDVPGAPEALARFAHAPPPTEAQLRLRFPRDEQSALAAAQPDSDAPLAGRIWERAQSLVTIRRGEEVVVGSSVAPILTHAKAALDAGDVAGAVSALEALKGQTAQAMAGWMTDAKALLSARSALAEMADQA